MQTGSPVFHTLWLYVLEGSKDRTYKTAAETEP